MKKISVGQSITKKDTDSLNKYFKDINKFDLISAEDRSAVPYVNIIGLLSKIGTSSDINGKYALEVPDSETHLVFSVLDKTSRNQPLLPSRAAPWRFPPYRSNGSRYPRKLSICRTLRSQAASYSLYQNTANPGGKNHEWSKYHPHHCFLSYS